MDRLRGFVRDGDNGVYLPERGYSAAFGYTNGLEVEKRLLEIIAKSKDLSSQSKELESAITDWPSRYHLSCRRANLIRALDQLPRRSNVLELGAGCGALTRYLGERFARVDAVEGSLLRARITRERCRDLPNVAVYAAPFSDIRLKPEYDLVTLVGVLEWAPLFGRIPSRDPKDACLSLLRLAASGVKRDGILILAIENALGLKYWSGCVEDHTNRPFDGIHGYPVKHSPVTLSRTELSQLLHQAGFNHLMFYSPFPDYKLPDTVIRETVISPDKLFLHNWIRGPFEDYSGKRDYYIHDSLAIRNLSRSNLLHELGNSFLVLSSRSRKAKLKSAWIAKRFTTERALPYQQVTSLYADPNPRIIKTKLLDIPGRSSILRLKNVKRRWIPGDLAIYSLYEVLYDDDVYGSLLRITKEYHRNLLDKFSSNVSDSDGYPLLTGDSFDFTFWNTIWNSRKQRYEYVDDEWKWNGRLPADYVLFRSLYYFILSQGHYLKARMPARDLETLLLDLIKEIYPQYDLERHQQNRGREEAAQTTVNGKNVVLASLSAPLVERTNLLETKEQLERTRAELSVERTNLLETKEQLERTRAELSSTRESLGHSIDKLASEVTLKTHSLALREEELARALDELALIRSSMAWRMAIAYRAILNSRFPAGTIRRSVLESLLSVSLKLISRLMRSPHSSPLSQTVADTHTEPDVYQEWKCEVARLLSGPRREHGARTREVDIVIPVHDAFQEVQKCIESVISNTSQPYRLLIVDDASTDHELIRYLDGVSRLRQVRLLRNVKNLGFVRSANIGFSRSDNDVVLLNSDTIVPPAWLERLWRCAYSYQEIGIVSPFSNRATICSIPRFCMDNELPADFDVNSLAQLVDHLSLRTYPALPTAVGFCMYVKREVLKEIGLFDESFSPGYEEENDFCMRAYAAKYASVLDDSTFVYHKGRASFDISGEGIARDHFELMGKKHPKYPRLVESFIAENPLRPLQDSITHALLEHYRSKLKKILYIVHAPLEDRAAGGTETHCRDLIENLHGTISYVLYPHGSLLFLEEYSPLGLQVSKYPKTWSEPNPIHDSQGEETLATILKEFKIDLVHVQHLLFLPLSLVTVAKQRGLKVILSCHDGYYACVQYGLLENGLNYCYGCVDLDRCDSCLQKQYGLPSGFQRTWRESSRHVLGACDAIVTASKSTFEIYNRILDVSKEKVRIIGHGIRKPNLQALQPRNPYQERVFRIGFIGNARERVKGRDTIVGLVEANTRDNIEWHFFGNRVDIAEWLPMLAGKTHAEIFVHDSYKRNLSEMLLEEGIHLVVLPYIGFEGFSLALSEVWAAGIPAVVPDISALSERMRQYGGGWLYEYGTPSQKILALIEKIMQNPEQYSEAVDRTRQIPITDTAECTRAYEELYESLLGNGNEQ
jgi:GT2 family glycosyltransferase/glycosyltransferase involved in cell wall biosynthesis